jgi:hypothetical protein
VKWFDGHPSKQMISLASLMEESLQIAWDYLERTGEIEDNWSPADISATPLN